jgi:hypothetical protein
MPPAVSTSDMPVSTALNKAFTQALSGFTPPPTTTPTTPAATPEAVTPPVETPVVTTPEPVTPEPKPVVTTPEPTVTPEPKVAVTPAVLDLEAAKAALKTPKSRENFDRLEQAKKEIEIQLVAERAKLVEMEEKLKTAVPPDYEEVKKQNQELIKTVEQLSLEHSPRFRQQFDSAMKTIEDKIKVDLAGTDVSPDDFIRWVKAPSSAEKTEKLNDILGSLSAVHQSKVGARMAQFEELADARQKTLDNFQTVRLQAEREQQQQQAKMREESATLFEETVKSMRETSAFFQEQEGNEAWNAHVKAIHAAARKTWLEPTTPESLARVTYQGHAFPLAVQVVNQLAEANAKMSQELAEIKKATAPVSASAPNNAVSNTPVSMGAVFRQAAGMS